MPQLCLPSLPTILPEILSLLKESYASVECQLESCPNVSSPPFNLSVAQLGHTIYIVPECVATQEAARLLISGKIVSTANTFHIVSDGKTSQVLQIDVDISTALNGNLTIIELRKVLRDYFEQKLGTNWEMLCIESSTNLPKSTIHLLRNCKSEDLKANGALNDDSNAKKSAHKISVLLAPISRRIVAGTTKSSNNINTDSSLANGNDDKLKKKKVIKKIIKQPLSPSNTSTTKTSPEILSNKGVETIPNGTSSHVKENGGSQSTVNEGNENHLLPKTNGIDSKQLKSTGSTGSSLVGKMTAMFSGTLSRKNSRNENSMPLKPNVNGVENNVNGITPLEKMTTSATENIPSLPPKLEMTNGHLELNNGTDVTPPVSTFDRPTSVSEFLVRHSSMQYATKLLEPETNNCPQSDDDTSFYSAVSTSAANSLQSTTVNVSTTSKLPSTMTSSSLSTTSKDIKPNLSSDNVKLIDQSSLTNGFHDMNAGKVQQNDINNNTATNGLSNSIVNLPIIKPIIENGNLAKNSLRPETQPLSKSLVTGAELSSVDNLLNTSSTIQTTKQYTQNSVSRNTTVIDSMEGSGALENTKTNKESEPKSNLTTLLKTNPIILNTTKNELLPPKSSVSKRSTTEGFSVNTSRANSDSISLETSSTGVLETKPSTISSTVTMERSTLPVIPTTTLTSSRLINNNNRKLSLMSSNGSQSGLSSITDDIEDGLRSRNDDDEDETLLLSSTTINGINGTEKRWSARRWSNEEDDSEALADFSLREDFSCSSTTSELYAKTFHPSSSSTIKIAKPSTSTINWDRTSNVGRQKATSQERKTISNQSCSSIVVPTLAKEMVRGMTNQIPVVALQQVFSHFTYNELCELRRVHPHWDELCGQLLNTGYYRLIHAADRLLTDCQRRVRDEKYLAKPIQVLTNLQVYVLNPVDMLRAAIDEGVICFPYGLILDKAFELLDRIEFVIRQNEEVNDALLNWERLAEFARRAQIHYRNVVEPEAERRMADVYKFSAVQRLQRIDSFFVEASVNKLEKETEKTKDDMRWEIEQLKTQNQQLKKDNRELKQSCLKLDSRIETLERKFKTMARLLQ